MRLLDKRFAGIAKGVGTQKILGRIHTGQIQIKESFIPQSFSVMEDQPMELLIGLGTGSILPPHGNIILVSFTCIYSMIRLH